MKLVTIICGLILTVYTHAALARTSSIDSGPSAEQCVGALTQLGLPTTGRLVIEWTQTGKSRNTLSSAQDYIFDIAICGSACNIIDESSSYSGIDLILKDIKVSSDITMGRLGCSLAADDFNINSLQLTVSEYHRFGRNYAIAVTTAALAAVAHGPVDVDSHDGGKFHLYLAK